MQIYCDENETLKNLMLWKQNQESNSDEVPHFLQSHTDLNLLGFEIIGMAKADGAIKKSDYTLLSFNQMKTSIRLRRKGSSSEPNYCMKQRFEII